MLRPLLREIVGLPPMNSGEVPVPCGGKVLKLLMVHHKPTYSLVVLPTIVFYIVLSPQIGLLILSLIIYRSGPMPEPPMCEQDVMLP